MNEFYIEIDNAHYLKELSLFDSGYYVRFTDDFNEAESFCQKEIDKLKAKKTFRIRQIPAEGEKT